MVYLIVWHDTDGNDCTVYDSIIGAKTEEVALEKLWNAWFADCPDAESDGDGGVYWPCDCPEDEKESCEGHGGTVIREVTAYRSYDRAEANLAFYHSRYDV